jgi:toxin FitB
VTDWLLDTNILSELRRSRPEARVVGFISAQPLETLYVSVVTFAELRFGIELLGDPVHRTVLNEWLANVVRPMFEGRALRVTEDVMLRWRMMVQEGRKAGITFSQPDLIIAATAADGGLTVVSRDTTEYRRAGVPVFDPWSDAA